MANRIFVSSVIGLWLISMTWLVAERVLPSFSGGEPPVAENYEEVEAIAWRVDCGGKLVGQAASVRVPEDDGSFDLHNRLRLINFPLNDLTPSWLRLAISDLGDVTFDALTHIQFDSQGDFSSFESQITLNDMPSALRLSGDIHGDHLQLKVEAADYSSVTPVYMPGSNSLSEALFPASRLSNLVVGRTWQEKVYSPFRTPGDSVELVHAEVTGIEWLQLGEEHTKVFRVEYHSASMSGVSGKSRLHAVSFVDAKNGTVLRRELFIGSTKLRFQRLFGEEAEEISGILFESLLDPQVEIPAGASATSKEEIAHLEAKS